MKKHQWTDGKPKEIYGYVMLCFFFFSIGFFLVNQTTDSDCFVRLAEVKIFLQGWPKWIEFKFAVEYPSWN